MVITTYILASKISDILVLVYGETDDEKIEADKTEDSLPKADRVENTGKSQTNPSFVNVLLNLLRRIEYCTKK